MKSLGEQRAESGVAVWDYPNQRFIPFVPCPGEQRVRIDVYDDPSNYGVYPVEYREDGSFRITSESPLSWKIDLT